ncbi:MAG: alpha/beta fold hydrolase [Candidatus Hermodarchaeia archaeon]|jgi:pimeloyl-ACP methyl ester carboxylesterase
MPTISIKGKQIYYEINGEGIPLVMIHGSLCRHFLWKQQQSLSEVAKLVLLDLPGHGESEPLEGRVTIRELAELVANIVEGLGLTEVVPVGHSLGGGIAIQLALNHPHLLKGLVLAGTGAKLGVLPAILEGLQTDFQVAIDLAIGQLGFASNTSSKVIEQVKSECLRCDPNIGYSDFAACNDFDERNRIQEITVPTLVLVGDQDQLTPIKWSQYLADKIPTSTLRIIKGAGHFVMAEQPRQFNLAIASFVKSL